jgi:hypothetical protein
MVRRASGRGLDREQDQYGASAGEDVPIGGADAPSIVLPVPGAPDNSARRSGSLALTGTPSLALEGAVDRLGGRVDRGDVARVEPAQEERVGECSVYRLDGVQHA